MRITTYMIYFSGLMSIGSQTDQRATAAFGRKDSEDYRRKHTYPMAGGRSGLHAKKAPGAELPPTLCCSDKTDLRCGSVCKGGQPQFLTAPPAPLHFRHPARAQ